MIPSIMRKDLDRHEALALLDDNYLGAFKLPEHLQVFGTASRLEMEPLVLAMRREMQRMDATEIRIYLAGDEKQWEPLHWRLLSELTRLHEAGYKIKLIIPRKSLKELAPSQLDELAAIGSFFGAEIRIPDVAPKLAESQCRLMRLLEVGSEKESVCWLQINLRRVYLPICGNGRSGRAVYSGRFRKTTPEFSRRLGSGATVRASGARRKHVFH